MDGRENNFDFLRIAAAYLVLFSHCFPLFGNPAEPFFSIAGHETGGDLAVAIFFYISGYLMSGSLERRPGFIDFTTGRALRILPGLFVSVAFCVLVIGPLYTNLPLGTYFAAPGTRHFFSNALVFPLRGDLPGVFLTAPFARAVNGSLLTLPIEVTLYGVLFALSRAGALRSAWGLAIPVLFYCALSYGQRHFGLDGTHQGGAILRSVPLFGTLKNGMFFFSGMAVFICRDRFRPGWLLGAAAACLLAAAYVVPLGFGAEALALPFFIHSIAHARVPLWRATRRSGDISYGLYVYAFPVQQAVWASCSSFLHFWSMMALSAAIATALALASWHLVEKPALAWKRKLLATAAR